MVHICDGGGKAILKTVIELQMNADFEFVWHVLVEAGKNDVVLHLTYSPMLFRKSSESTS